MVQGDLVPWRPSPLRELQFGEWLRDALQRGMVAGRAHNPDVALLVTQVRAHGLALHGPAPGSLLPAVPAGDVRTAIHAMLPGLLAHLAGEALHALLTLARMWVTLGDGRIVSRDNAVAQLLPRLPPGHRAVFERARDAYLGRGPNDWSGWEARVQAAARWIAPRLGGGTGGT